jgi:hypothetical protein
MAKPAPDLSSVYLKLDRASEHMDSVSEQTKAFLERKPAPFGFRTEPTVGPDKVRTYTLYATVRREPPRELGLVVGDAIANIRHALDHLIYEMSPPSARRRGKTGFPIYTDRCEFQVLGATLLRGIKGDERTMIERHQPYQSGQAAVNHPLAILNRLANQDKHRVLLPLVAAVNNTGTWIGSTNANIKIGYFRPGPVEHDTKIMEFTATPEDPAENVHVEPQSGLQIQLANTGTINMDLEVSELLGMCWHYVRHSLIDMWFKWGQMPPATAPP